MTLPTLDFSWKFIQIGKPKRRSVAVIMSQRLQIIVAQLCPNSYLWWLLCRTLPQTPLPPGAPSPWNGGLKL